jgi:5-methylcytosine-specific restriction enzyme A
MVVPRARRACVRCGRAHTNRGNRCDACGGPKPAARPSLIKRESAAKRGYGRKWRQARIEFLADHVHRICESCKAAIATEVDHIAAHKGDLKLFWSRSNWQGLCKPCHSRKTMRENG